MGTRHATQADADTGRRVTSEGPAPQRPSGKSANAPQDDHAQSQPTVLRWGVFGQLGRNERSDRWHPEQFHYKDHSSTDFLLLVRLQGLRFIKCDTYQARRVRRTITPTKSDFSNDDRLDDTAHNTALTSYPPTLSLGNAATSVPRMTMNSTKRVVGLLRTRLSPPYEYNRGSDRKRAQGGELTGAPVRHPR